MEQEENLSRKVDRMPQIVPDGNRYKIVGTDNDAKFRGMTKEFARKVFNSLFGVPTPATTTVKKRSDPMDLGQLLGGVQQIADIYSTVKNTRTPTATPAFFPEVMQGVDMIQDFGGLGVPGGDFVPNPPAANCGGSPVYKKVCGEYKWVYPKRRRRKALVTKSDAQGLATLKGIVGVGKTMDTWIATHS